MTASVVSSVPIHSVTVSAPIDSMRRYSSAMFTDAHDHRDGRRRRRGPSRPDVARVVGEPDVAGGDLERAAQDELPDEQERHQPARSVGPEPFAQVLVRPARPRHRRAELAPDQPVGRRRSPAPPTQPASACGPPSPVISSGMVMNGPTPIMFDMFSAVAGSRREAALEGGGGIGSARQKCRMHNAQCTMQI